MSVVFLVIAIILYVIAGLHFMGVVTINDPDVMAFVAFGLAAHAAAHLPWPAHGPIQWR